MGRNELALTPPGHGRLWLLGALFLVTLPHLLRMPAWLSVSCLLVFGWRLLHELRGYDLPGRWLRYLIVIIGIAAVGGAYRTLLGPDAGVALLTVMLCLKLLELRTLRDAMIALFIGYFMVVGGFLFSQSIAMGGYLFLVVLALTATLIALNHPAGRLADYRLYLSTGGKLLLQSLPLMLLMFLLFPRLSNPLWSVPEQGPSARTGLSDTIEMGTISNLVQSQAVAFRVDFDGGVPAADALYWRGPVLWHTDGRRWERMQMPIQREPPAFEVLGEEVAYTVTLEPHRRRWIFALDLPLNRPRAANTAFYFLPDFQLLSEREVKEKLRYAMRSATAYRLDTLSPAMHAAATALPGITNPRTRRLAQQWLEEGITPAEIVQRGYRLFREQPFYYTRQPPQLGDDPVDEFLFSTRRGFCEHYASAFVTLMRAAGLPARIVAGYQGGEFNELGDYLIVRQSNAHAWAEVWLQEQGWLRVDPTTAVPASRVESSVDAARFQSTSSLDDGAGFAALRKLYRQFRYGWDALNHSWNQWVLGFDRQKQLELLRKLGLHTASWGWLAGIMVGLVMAVVALIALLTLFRRPPRRDPVARLYQRFCDKLAKAGLPRQLDEGPTDFAARVSAARPELASAVQRISQLYIRLRYTRHGGTQDIESLRRLVREFKAQT
ncbi:MAG: DUF3488 and transglutaminase-like domain-containing protein [Gammaproteobacteria bacterium]|nr:DUF3488 and transglutaminase-like domain-containing protein [Gammaproteobacteria bacterium]